MRIPVLSAALAILASSYALAQAPPDVPARVPASAANDPHDPAVLEAMARERERAGDTSTARILRARAARILPPAMRLDKTLRERPSGPAGASPRPAAPAIDLPPEPPALWPAK